MAKKKKILKKRPVLSVTEIEQNPAATDIGSLLKALPRKKDKKKKS